MPEMVITPDSLVRGMLDDSLSLQPSDAPFIEKDSAMVVAKDSVVRKKSSLEAPVFSTGKDSTVYDMDGENKMIYYYGEVTVTHQDMELKADYMEYNTRTRTVYARGSRDSTGHLVGNPEMREGIQTYAMEEVHYNFGTKKAIISNVITQEGDGYLHGVVIKKMPDNSINVKGGKYTTCDHDHPHFYLHMTQARVLQDPKQTVFGPSYLVLEDVPLYPLLLPFGFIPDRPSRSGGILFPTFSDEVSRGFAIRELGYYFVLGDYADLAVTTDIYTRGSWRARGVARYTKRYKFSGGFDIDYADNVIGEKGSTDYQSNREFAVRWSHTQDPKARPGTMFSASVNYSSSAYNIYQGRNPQQSLQNTASSSISYRKSWEGSPFNLSLNLQHSQAMLDSSYALTLPNVTLTMNRIYPFKIKNRVGRERWYEQFAFTYNTTFDNKIKFKERELGDEPFTNFMRNGMKHSFGINLPTMTLFKFVQLTPSVNYGMNWFFQSTQKIYNSEKNVVESDISPAFSEFHITNEYSFGLAASTRVYGTFLFGNNSLIRAFRHMITPTLSFTYKPEQGTYANGYRTFYYIDKDGNNKALEYNIFEGQSYGYPAKGRTGSMSFSLGNNIEMKVRDHSDTTGAGERKVKLIDNLTISASYNFFADSMKLSNISVNANTTIFEKLGISANMLFNPYEVNAYGSTYNKLTSPWLMSAGISFGYNFQGGDGKKSDSQPVVPMPINRYKPETGEFVMTEWLYYTDFSAPWSFGFNYGYNYSRSYNYTNGQLNMQHNHMQTLGFSGQIQLTDAMNIRISSGFDFKEMEITTTTFDLRYDLHCFEFIFNWVPSGRWEQWSFRINAKSSALADLLKFDKRKSFWDN